MAAESHAEVKELHCTVEEIEQMLGVAEQQLQGLAAIGEQTENTLALALDKFSDIGAKSSVFEAMLLNWQAMDLSPFQQSEVTRSLGLVKRLELVTKNILRLCKKALDIDDPQRQQEELEVRLTMMQFSGDFLKDTPKD